MSNEIDIATRSLPAPVFGMLTLPLGIQTGFASVTLGYVLSHHGFSVAAVAGLIGLSLLPSTWRFLVGPFIDVSLTPRLWYLLSNGLMSLSFLGVALVPLELASLPILSLLVFTLGVTSNVAGSAKYAVVATTVPSHHRGAVAGWMQAGNLGGTGLGGGIGLMIATQFGMSVAAVSLAAGCILLSLPMLWARTPRQSAGVGLGPQAAGLWRAMWALLCTRDGILAIIASVLPVGLGAAATLLSAVAGDWSASANEVALATGILGGLASMPGCIAGGYLANRFGARPAFIIAGLVGGCGEAAMALAPHTPVMFMGFVLLNNVLLGVAWGALTAVTLEVLKPAGAATVGAVLASVSNLPVVVGIMFIGAVQIRHGSATMLLVEAGLAVLSVITYSLLAVLWRPAAKTFTTATATA